MSATHSQAQGYLPDHDWIGWIPWANLWGPSDREVQDAIRRLGTYLLAHFPNGEPQAVDPVDKQIFYVGETHGRTRALRARLRDFGMSAGFFGAQRSGHYAAWRFPEEFPTDGAKHVYVAVCPTPPKLEPARRGVFPTLIESQVLWRYVSENGELPLLNNSGRLTVNVPPQPSLLDADVTAALNHTEAPNDAMAAVQSIANRIGTALGYNTRQIARAATFEDWHGAVRPLGSYQGAVGRLYVGWEKERPGVDISIYFGNDRWFGGEEDGSPAESPEKINALIECLWNRWFRE